jgi:hypothetical protein
MARVELRHRHDRQLKGALGQCLAGAQLHEQRHQMPQRRRNMRKNRKLVGERPIAAGKFPIDRRQIGGQFIGWDVTDPRHGESLFVLSRRLHRYDQIPEVVPRFFAKWPAGIPRRGVGNKAMAQRLILGPPKPRSDVLCVARAAGHNDVVAAVRVIDDRGRLAIRHEAKRRFERRIPGLRGIGSARGQSADDHQ